MSLLARNVSLASERGGLLSHQALPALQRFLADTRHASKRTSPRPSADQPDPVLEIAAE